MKGIHTKILFKSIGKMADLFRFQVFLFFAEFNGLSKLKTTKEAKANL